MLNIYLASRDSCFMFLSFYSASLDLLWPLWYSCDIIFSQDIVKYILASFSAACIWVLLQLKLLFCLIWIWLVLLMVVLFCVSFLCFCNCFQVCLSCWYGFIVLTHCLYASIVIVILFNWIFIAIFDTVCMHAFIYSALITEIKTFHAFCGVQSSCIYNNYLSHFCDRDEVSAQLTSLPYVIKVWVVLFIVLF